MSRWATHTQTWLAWAWRAMLSNPSATLRMTDSPNASGTGEREENCVVQGMPVAAVKRRVSSSSACCRSVGVMVSVRRSSMAERAVASEVRARPMAWMTISSARSSRPATRWALTASNCRIRPANPWASVSCNSRAIRCRSAALVSSSRRTASSASWRCACSSSCRSLCVCTRARACLSAETTTRTKAGRTYNKAM